MTLLSTVSNESINDNLKKRYVFCTRVDEKHGIG